MYIKQTTI